VSQMNQSIGSRSNQSFLFYALWVVFLFLYYERTQRYPLLVVSQSVNLFNREGVKSRRSYFFASTVTPKR